MNKIDIILGLFLVTGIVGLVITPTLKDEGMDRVCNQIFNEQVVFDSEGRWVYDGNISEIKIIDIRAADLCKPYYKPKTVWNAGKIKKGIDFDGNGSYVDVTNYSPPINNISVITLMNAINLSADLLKWQKDDDNVSYFVSIDIKAIGWHEIRTDIYSTIYFDGQPLVRRMNQQLPNYSRFVTTVINDGEYTIVNGRTFLTSKWIKFDGNWTTVTFYIGHINDRDRALKPFEIGHIYNISKDYYTGKLGREK